MYQHFFPKFCNTQLKENSNKKTFFSNFHVNDITDNKTALKKIKTFILRKVDTKSKIKLLEKENLSRGKKVLFITENIISNQLF